MSDVKISQLPNGTTPLAGTEAVPIVQSSQTVQVPASAFGPTLPLTPANGGTGIQLYAIGDLLYASGTTTLARLADVATGNVLLSGGVGTAPLYGKVNLTSVVVGTLPVTNGGTGVATFSQGDVIYASASNTLSALSKSASATRYLSNTGSSNNPAWAQVVLTNGVTGTLPVTNGGTGLATFTQGDVIYASASNTLSALAKSATATRYLANTGSSNNPNWDQVSLANGVTGTLPIGSGGTGQTTANNALNALLPNQATHSGQFLTTDGSNTSWASAGGGASSAVEYFQFISDQSSGAASGTLTLMNTSATINDGDSVFVQFYGTAVDGAASPDLNLQLDVNGDTLPGLFFAVNLIANFQFTLQITRSGAFVSYVGFAQIGEEPGSAIDPSDAAHMTAIQSAAPYAGTLTVSLPFAWTASSIPSVEVVGGFAQIMRAPAIVP